LSVYWKIYVYIVLM